MKPTKFFLLLFVGVIAGTLISAFRSTESHSPCDSPMVGDHSGAPGETDCSGCHAGVINTGPGSLEFHVGNDSTYVPGQTYNCTVSMMQGSLSKFGFSNLALRDSNNTSAGLFNLIDSARTRKYTVNNRRYFSHTPCGADADTLGRNYWYYTWTAPSTNVGTIKLYISSLASNHDHATTGDDTYTDIITLNPTTTAGLNATAGINTVIYPVPASDKIILSGLPGGEMDIKVFDANGRKIVVNYSLNNTSAILDVSELQDGIYFLNIQSGSEIISKKFIIK